MIGLKSFSIDIIVKRFNKNLIKKDGDKEIRIDQ